MSSLSKSYLYEKLRESNQYGGYLNEKKYLHLKGEVHLGVKLTAKDLGHTFNK